MTCTEPSAPLPGVEAHPGDGRYGVFDQGAQVFSWRPDGAAHDVLWLSSASPYAPGKAIRGGVPICFPWFGPGRNGDKTPAHGFVRQRAWRREAVHDRLDRGELEVEYLIDDSLTGEQPLFPHPYSARLTVRFTPERLQLSLRTDNPGTEPFRIEQALHTYLAVSDVRRVSVHGLEGARYLDKVAGDSGFGRTHFGPLRFTGPTDRVFSHSGEVTLDDPGHRRRLRIGTTGAADVVVWNPWSDGADAMADMGPGEWRTMLCIEAANAFDDSVTVQPGESATISQQIDLLAA